MASHVFSELFVHLNWHTEGDVPQLTPEVEVYTHKFMENYCKQYKGVYCKGVNGTETHVHLVIQFEPFVCLSDFLQKVKGASSHETNKYLGRKGLSWQRGYGGVTFGKRQLAWVLDYVAKQKEHHAKGTIYRRLEITGDDEYGNPADAGSRIQEDYELPAETSGKKLTKARLKPAQIMYGSLHPPAKAGGKQQPEFG